MRLGEIDQHLQSRALIKRFLDTDNRLRFYDIRSGRSVVRSYGRAGRGGAFTPHNPIAIETLWGSVESNAPRAFAAVDEGTIFRNPDLVQTLKHLIALHFFRAARFRGEWESNVQERLRELYQRIRSRFGTQFLPYLSDAVGHEVTAENAFETFMFFARSRAEFESMFQELETSWFQRAGVDVGSKGLEIFDTTGGLAITDRGAVPFGEDGLPAELSFLGAAALVLPIGPHHLISLGAADQRTALTHEETSRVNAHQFALADRWAYSHPNNDLCLR